MMLKRAHNDVKKESRVSELIRVLTAHNDVKKKSGIAHNDVKKDRRLEIKGCIGMGLAHNDVKKNRGFLS